MNISPKTFSLILPIVIFILSGGIWFFILAQYLNFFLGLVILSALSFIIFWQGLIISRKYGELFILKNKRQAAVVSLIATLGLCELIWAISFLPFPFFVLAGLFSAMFFSVFDVLKEHFKKQPGLFEEADQKKFKRVLLRNILGAIVFAIIIILISPWLPLRVQ